MITNRIYEWARLQPTKLALISNDVPFSYADFARSVEAARNFFAQQSLPATRTAIVLAAGIDDAWVFILALRALGLNTASVNSVAQAFALELKNLAAIIVANAHPEASKLNRGGVNDAKIIRVPSDLFDNIRTGDLPLPLHPAPPFGGHILVTSGTTGSYKKELFAGKFDEKRNAARAQIYPLNKSTIFRVGNLGLWSSGGFKMPAAVWHSGGTVVMDTREGAFKHFFRYPIGLTMLTPSMLRELTASLETGPTHDTCELLVTSGFLPVDLEQRTLNRVTKNVGINYGSTEIATPVLLSRSNDQDRHWLAPVGNRSIRIIDTDGNDCRHGQQGELCFELKDIDCGSYLDDDASSATNFRGRFFYPGDMAVSRVDGRIRILGRTADVLNVQGQKYAVAPLEMEVQRKLRVEQVCLFSGLNAAGQEELVVTIEGDAEVPQTSREQVAREFPEFAVVRFVRVKEFPRTAGARKVNRLALRRLAFPQ